MSPSNVEIRRSVLAGSWYTSDGKALRAELAGYIAGAGEIDLPKQPIAVVGPHAGYSYSGPTAGYAYKAVSSRTFDVVVCVGPIHQPNPIRKASVFNGEAVVTPLGEVRIHRELTEKLLENGELFEPGGSNHEGENTVELQVPFLQAVLDEFRYVEILVRDQSVGTHIRTGEAIAGVLRGLSFLLIASTDLSHYPKQSDAERCDAATLEALSAPEPRKAKENLEKVRGRFADVLNLDCVMCGESAVLTVMAAAKALGATGGKILNYSNSGMTGGGPGRVVGYGALAYY